MCLLILPALTQAGGLDPLGAPDSPSSAMHTVDALYDQMESGTVPAKRSGPFQEPTSAPGSTGHTLDDLQAILPVPDDITGTAVDQVPCGTYFWSLRSASWGLQEGTLGTQLYYPDTDNDTYGDQEAPLAACSQPIGYILDNSDCDDTNPAINPDAEDLPAHLPLHCPNRMCRRQSNRRGHPHEPRG